MGCRFNLKPITMSTNYNRAITKNCTNNSEYKKVQLKINYPPYWDEGDNLIKGLYSCQYRSYKTWKHNRKTQYKVRYL